MKYNKAMWGIILILIGLMLLLKHMGLVYFEWHSLFSLWPVLFIFWGISVLPFKDYVKLILGIITLIFAIYLFQRSDGRLHWGNSDSKEDTITAQLEEQTLTEPYNQNIESAILKLNAAAGNYIINDVTDELIWFNKKGNIGNYIMGMQKQGDSATVIRIDLDSHIHISHSKGNDVKIKLNPHPIWDMEFDIGAAKTDFDLSQYRTKSVNIDGGAASINLKLGDKFYRTKVDINTGASNIMVNIPKTSGCQVNSTTFLVDKNMEGFTKTKNDGYTTENFKISSNKIFIDIDAAISSLKIIRY